MEHVEGAKTFGVTGATYDSFMGRYSRLLADRFADAAGVRRGQTAVDVGCGPGALTSVLVERLGVEAVAACDPASGFVTECAARLPGVRVEVGRAESIPFEACRFDHAMAQLVLQRRCGSRRPTPISRSSGTASSQVSAPRAPIASRSPTMIDNACERHCSADSASRPHRSRSARSHAVRSPAPLGSAGSAR
jgi:SAM-dependent methyltransferase